MDEANNNTRGIDRAKRLATVRKRRQRSVKTDSDQCTVHVIL